MKKDYKVLVAAVTIGVTVAVLFRLFELGVNYGTDLIWNDWFNTDTERWRVVPLAIALSILFTMLVKKVGEKRLVKPQLGVASEIAPSSTSLKKIGTVLLVGLASLLAGASLGPEASLLAASSLIGVLIAKDLKSNKASQLLNVASIGALLVAFLGSLFMALVPLLLIYQKQKKITFPQTTAVILASASAYGTLWIIDNKHLGFGTVPVLNSPVAIDYALAFSLGITSILLAALLKLSVENFFKATKRIYDKTNWIVSSGMFGLVLGVLYLIGGQTVQFSGNTGSAVLLETSAEYGLWALAGFVAIKILAVGWSLAIGYRGGLVFPSIYVGLALGLFVERLIPGSGGAGIVVGGIAGMLSAVTGSAIMTAIFLLALLPISLAGVLVAGVAGTVVGSKLLGINNTEKQ